MIQFNMLTQASGQQAVWAFSSMQYLGGKLSAAQLQVTGLVGSVRRSVQGALDLVWGQSNEKQEEEEEDDKEEEEEEEGGDGGGRFQRAISPLRSFARRSRRSLRRFSLRSRQTMQRRAPETCSVRADAVSLLISIINLTNIQSDMTLLCFKAHGSFWFTMGMIQIEQSSL